MNKRAWLIAALICLPLPADACLNAVSVRLDALVRRIDEADRTLLTGRTREAMRGAVWVVRVIDNHDEEHTLLLESDAAVRRAALLRSRARAVLALAIVRRDGHVDRRHWSLERVDAATRTANLEWALSILQERADAPAAQAHLAEALARFPARRAQALTILRSLSERDLMPDAWAHRTLALLADERGDRNTRDRAVQACQERAGTLSSTICPRIVYASR